MVITLEQTAVERPQRLEKGVSYNAVQRGLSFEGVGFLGEKIIGTVHRTYQHGEQAYLDIAYRPLPSGHRDYKKVMGIQSYQVDVVVGDITDIVPTSYSIEQRGNASAAHFSELEQTLTMGEAE